MTADLGARYGDAALRGMHRVATYEDDKWPGEVVANLIDEIIRRRGTDKIWLALHPSPDDGSRP